MQEPGGFFHELRRRSVFRMAGLYLVAAWLIGAGEQAKAPFTPGDSR